MSFWLVKPLLEMVALGLKTKSLGVRPDEQQNLSILYCHFAIFIGNLILKCVISDSHHPYDWRKLLRFASRNLFSEETLKNL